MVNDKFYNRYNRLKEMKLIDRNNKYYIEYYNGKNSENEKIRKILIDQKICFEKYFKCEEMALLFMEGLNPENKSVNQLDQELMLASIVNGYFVSLLCQTMIIYMKSIKKTTEFSNIIIDTLIDNTDLENKKELIGGLSTYVDYKMVFILDQMGDIDIKIKKYIFEWYDKRLQQIVRVWNLLKDSKMVEKESELNKIWGDDSYISSYQLGMICSGREGTICREENESIIKEFEFWFVCRWLGYRIECDSIFFQYINSRTATERMRELKEQVKDSNLRDILNFYCTNLSSIT